MQYQEIEGRSDKRLVKYNDVEFIIDIPTGFFNTIHTCKLLAPLKVSNIKSKFLLHENTKEYILKRYNYDIEHDRNSKSPYFVEALYCRSDPCRGYYFHMDLFILFIIWVDKTKVLDYIQTINALFITKDLTYSGTSVLMDTVKEMKNKVEEMNEEIECLEQINDELSVEIENVNNTIKKQDDDIVELFEEIELKDRNIKLLNENIDALNSLNKNQKTIIKELKSRDKLINEIVEHSIISPKLAKMYKKDMNISGKFVMKFWISEHRNNTLTIDSCFGYKHEMKEMNTIFDTEVSCSLNDFHNIIYSITPLIIKNSENGFIIRSSDLNTMKNILRRECKNK